MNARDLAASWQLFHQASGLGAPIVDERQYEDALTAVGELMEGLAADETSPSARQIAGLVELLTERIQEYEARVHPWPDNTTPAQVLRFLMDQHGMKQADLSNVGSQGVVSEILNGKRDLNVRQIGQLAEIFHVSPATFFPAAQREVAAAH
ncbi:transcriptional regulator [Comamonas phosphati]|nr:transcriptional regulator [Comamonas phosphati]